MKSFITALLCLTLSVQASSQFSEIEQQAIDLRVNGSDSATWQSWTDKLPKTNPFRLYVAGILAHKRQQFDKADSLLLLARDEFKQINSAGRILCNRELTANGVLRHKYETAAVYAKECIEGCDGKLPSIRGHCIQYLGLSRRSAEDIDSALSLVNEALDIFTKAGLENDAGYALMNLGSIYHYQDKYDSATYFYLEAAKRFETSRDLHQLAKCYNNIAVVATSIGDLDRAKHYLSLCIKTHEENESILSLGNAYTTLGNIYLREQKYDSATFAFRLGKNQYRKAKDREGLMWSNNNLGTSSYYQGNPDSSQYYYLSALAIAKELKDSLELARIYNNLAWNFMDANQLDSAKSYLDVALKIAKANASLESEEMVLESYADYFLRKKDFEKALEYYAAGRDIREKILNENLNKQFAELETKYQTEQKEAEILALENEKAQAQLQISRQRSMIIGAFAGLILLLSGGALLFVQRKRKAEAALAKQELEFRKQMLDATVIAQEEERQRIAKDLHDGLVQSLAAIKMGFQSLGRKLNPREELKTDYASKVQMLDDAANEARHISHQMMPRALMEAGLIAALDDMLEKTLGTSEIDYRFEHFGIENERFKQSIEIGLYRISQELVNNIIKHSKAKSVEVQLFKTKTHIVLHVEDDGTGFKLTDKQKQSGIGLSNIFSRASAVNGEVNYEEGQPKGTIANVRIPLLE